MIWLEGIKWLYTIPRNEILMSSEVPVKEIYCLLEIIVKEIYCLLEIIIKEIYCFFRNHYKGNLLSFSFFVIFIRTKKFGSLNIG